MDKIFKNDKIMGIVAVATLVLVAVMYFKNCKKDKDSAVTTTAVPAAEE